MQKIYAGQLHAAIIPALIHSKYRRGSLPPSRSDDPVLEKRCERVLARFSKKLQALFLHTFPNERLSTAVSHSMHEIACRLFGLAAAVAGDRNRPDHELVTLTQQLQEVGLGNEFGQRAFASAVWRLVNDFMSGQYMTVDWGKKKSRKDVLTRWINHGLVPLVHRVVTILGGTPDESVLFNLMALARLGTGRIENMFDYIVKWDLSVGAIRDIKEFITTPEARLYMTNAFSDQIDRRLLHAGATTTHILNIYINIIRSFNELDSKGVLLDRVARPIRRYLRLREDTARIIVSSLLADVEDSDGLAAENAADISIEIAKEMAKPIAGVDNEDDHMDWENLEWTPDPIDVSADFKRMKNQDVTSALLSLYDREEFINELKTILGEHLLRNYDINEHFEKEERLLELFKNRLGEDRLQACEVMLRDVQSSRQMNKAIHRLPQYLKLSKQVGFIDLHTHILSSFFWPSLKDDQFIIPEPVRQLQKDYEAGFESVKDMRKLQWLTALGRVTVELELEDRRVEEDVPTWTASVIYAFQSDDDTSPTKTITELCEELEMEETLVRNATMYWRSKQVLREEALDTFSVIENLSSEPVDDGDTAMPLPLAEDSGVSAVKSQQDLLNENADLYKQFVASMLTAQGNMPLMRIHMMLKVIVPGGFSFGVEELGGLLQEMVDEGRLVAQGEVYGINKN